MCIVRLAVIRRVSAAHLAAVVMQSERGGGTLIIIIDSS